MCDLFFTATPSSVLTDYLAHEKKPPDSFCKSVGKPVTIYVVKCDEEWMSVLQVGCAAPLESIRSPPWPCSQAADWCQGFYSQNKVGCIAAMKIKAKFLKFTSSA